MNVIFYSIEFKLDKRIILKTWGYTISSLVRKDGMLWDETKIGYSSQSSTACIGGRKKWGYEEGNSLLK